MAQPRLSVVAEKVESKLNVVGKHGGHLVRGECSPLALEPRAHGFKYFALVDLECFRL